MFTFVMEESEKRAAIKLSSLELLEPELMSKILMVGDDILPALAKKYTRSSNSDQDIDPKSLPKMKDIKKKIPDEVKTAAFMKRADDFYRKMLSKREKSFGPIPDISAADMIKEEASANAPSFKKTLMKIAPVGAAVGSAGLGLHELFSYLSKLV